MLLTLGHMDLSITLTQSPPMLACTPYQILYRRVSRFPNFLADTKSAHHAITPRLNVHQRLPYNPKLERATTGNGMWNTAPCRAFNATNGPTKPYPSQTQIHACHHDRPSWIIDDAIIHLYHHAHTGTNHGRRLSLTCSR